MLAVLLFPLFLFIRTESFLKQGLKRRKKTHCDEFQLPFCVFVSSLFVYVCMLFHQECASGFSLLQFSHFSNLRLSFLLRIPLPYYISIKKIGFYCCYATSFTQRPDESHGGYSLLDRQQADWKMFVQ